MGTVELTAGELTVDTMSCAPGYAAIPQVVRDASIALLQLGFLGSATRSIDEPDGLPFPGATSMSSPHPHPSCSGDQYR